MAAGFPSDSVMEACDTALAVIKSTSGEIETPGQTAESIAKAETLMDANIEAIMKHIRRDADLVMRPDDITGDNLLHKFARLIDHKPHGHGYYTALSLLAKCYIRANETFTTAWVVENNQGLTPVDVLRNMLSKDASGIDVEGRGPIIVEFEKLIAKWSMPLPAETLARLYQTARLSHPSTPTAGAACTAGHW